MYFPAFFHELRSDSMAFACYSEGPIYMSVMYERLSMIFFLFYCNPSYKSTAKIIAFLFNWEETNSNAHIVYFWMCIQLLVSEVRIMAEVFSFFSPSFLFLRLSKHVTVAQNIGPMLFTFSFSRTDKRY